MERPRHARAGLHAILIAAIGLACLYAGGATSEPTARDIPGLSQAGGLSRADVRRRVEKLSELGRAMFFDPALSSSGKMSCASCHDPQHGFSPTNDMAVQRGGSDLRQA